MKCINKKIPLRTSQEYYRDNKELYQKHAKLYRENHKQEIAEYQKSWRGKITCECGKTICREQLSRHKRSQFHLNNVSQN